MQGLKDASARGFLESQTGQEILKVQIAHLIQKAAVARRAQSTSQHYPQEPFVRSHMDNGVLEGSSAFTAVNQEVLARILRQQLKSILLEALKEISSYI
jgi:hypothetical protein